MSIPRLQLQVIAKSTNLSQEQKKHEQKLDNYQKEIGMRFEKLEFFFTSSLQLTLFDRKQHKTVKL